MNDYSKRIDELLDRVIKHASETQRLAEELQGAVDALERAYDARDADADSWGDYANTLYEAGIIVCECGEVLNGIERIAEHDCDQRREAA